MLPAMKFLGVRKSVPVGVVAKAMLSCVDEPEMVKVYENAQINQMFS